MEMTAREKDLVYDLDLICQMHERGQTTLAESVCKLIRWVHDYENLTGTTELRRRISPLYTTGETLDYIARLIDNTTFTPEEKLKKLKSACCRIKSDAAWYSFQRDVFFPLDYYDLLCLMLDIKNVITAEWFRKTIKIKENVKA